MGTTPTYTISDTVLTAHLEGEAVLLDMESKSYFRLNETGAAIWSALERGLTPDAVIGELCARFEIDASAASAEVDRLLGELRDQGLVTERAPDAVNGG